MANWRQHGELFQGSGWHWDISSPTGAQGYNNDLYIIFPKVAPFGNYNKLGLGIDVVLWGIGNTAGNTTPVVDGFARNTQSMPAINNKKGKISSFSWSDSYEVDYDKNSSVFFGGTGYSVTQYSIPNALVKSVAVYTEPINLSTLQSQSSDSNGQYSDANLKNDTFNIGQILRGADGSNYDKNGSLGTLAQHQNTTQDHRQSMLSLSTLCVFQWGHPAGVKVKSGRGGLDWVSAFSSWTTGSEIFKIPVQGRNFRGHRKLNLAGIGSWETGAQVRMSSQNTGDTVTASMGTASLTPNGFVLEGLDYDPAGDFITIEFLVEQGLIDIIYNTIALFEDTHGTFTTT